MRIAFPILDGVDDLALGGALRALADPEHALAVSGWSVATVGGEAMVTTASGLRVVPDRLGWGHLKDADVIVVCGGPGVAERVAREPQLVGALRAHLAGPSSTRLLAAVDSGVLVLARAGLLEGRRVAAARAHRDAVAAAAAELPLGVRVVQDGRVVTAVGPAAGVELGLHVLARVAGAEAATRASERLEVRGWAPPAGT